MRNFITSLSWRSESSLPKKIEKWDFGQSLEMKTDFSGNWSELWVRRQVSQPSANFQIQLFRCHIWVPPSKDRCKFFLGIFRGVIWKDNPFYLKWWNWKILYLWEIIDSKPLNLNISKRVLIKEKMRVKFRQISSRSLTWLFWHKTLLDFDKYFKCFPPVDNSPVYFSHFPSLWLGPFTKCVKILNSSLFRRKGWWRG